MWAEIEKLNAMMTTVLATQTQTSIPHPANNSLAQTNTSAMPISTVFASTPQHAMLEVYLWSTPFGSGEVLCPVISEVQALFVQTPIPQLGPLFPQVTMTYSAPLVHKTQHDRIPTWKRKSSHNSARPSKNMPNGGESSLHKFVHVWKRRS